MPTALAETLAAVREMKAQKLAAYQQLVELLAGDDVDVDPAEVVEVVVAAGKTMDDLSADTNRLSARRVDAATLANLPAAETAHAKAGRHLAAETARAAADLERRLADLENQRRQAVADHDGRVAVAQAAVDRAGAAVRECQTARERLAETAPADLRARVSELRAQRQFALSRVGDARQAVDREDALIRRTRESLPPAPHPNEITDPSRTRAGRAEAEEHANRIIGAAQQRRARAAEALREATAELAALDAELANAESALLQP